MIHCAEPDPHEDEQGTLPRSVRLLGPQGQPVPGLPVSAARPGRGVRLCFPEFFHSNAKNTAKLLILKFFLTGLCPETPRWSGVTITSQWCSPAPPLPSFPITFMLKISHCHPTPLPGPTYSREWYVMPSDLYGLVAAHTWELYVNPFSFGRSAGFFFQWWIRHSLALKCPKNWVMAKFPWVRADFSWVLPNLGNFHWKKLSFGQILPLSDHFQFS